MTAARRQPGVLMRRFNASPTHEPRHAANYGDGWQPLNAPRLKPAQAGLKHGTSPRTPPRHGWQDIQAGSTQCNAGMTP